MFKNKYAIGTVVVLFLIVAVYNINFFFGKQKKKISPPQNQEINRIPVSNNPDPALQTDSDKVKTSQIDQESWKEKLKSYPPKISSLANWVRDPFTPNVSEPLKQASGEDKKDNEILNLSAILIQEGRKVAILNHKILFEGNEINGKKVKEIFRDSIKISDDNGDYILSLNKSKIPLKIDHYQ